MKKILLLLLFPIIAMSQEPVKNLVSTTQEEYNYLTKGYAEDLAKGYEIKKGYELEKFYEFKNENFNFQYYYFNEISVKKTKAVLVIAKKEKGSNDKIAYMCIPFNNKDLLKESFTNKIGGVTIGYLYDTVNYVMLSKALYLLKNDPTGTIQK